MQVQPISSSAQNSAFKSNVVMSPEAIEVIAQFPSHVRKDLKKQINQFGRNGKNDTIYISGYDILTARLSMQIVEKNGGKILKSLQKVFCPAVIDNYKLTATDLKPRYEKIRRTLAPANRDMFNKYLG